VTSVARDTSGNRDEIDLVAVWRIAWAHKLLIGLVAVVCAAAAVVLALLAQPIYRAEIIVSEVKSGGNNSVGALADRFGGIASLVGLDFAAGGTSYNSKAFLKSRRVVEEFVKRRQPIERLFPSADKSMTLWLAVNTFQDRVISIHEDTRTGVITVSVDWSNPDVAATWANEFVALVNEMIRTRAIEEAKRNLAYLNEQIAQTNVVELQGLLYNLAENETKTLMLANGKAEYAFTVIDPAVPPEVRISPRRTVMVIVGAGIGLLLGVIVAFIRHWIVQSRAAS
jgi:uncharacterized protein involved in exopolysaccharide biosynthesis